MSSVNSTSSPSFTNRYWGLASGLDVESIVEGLCSDVQTQIDNVKKEEQKLEWKQTAYRDVISALEDFQKAYLQAGSSTSMALQSAYTSYTANSSNTALLTVKANYKADGQSQTVQVLQSAVSASLSSSAAIRGNIKGNILSDTSASVLVGKSLTMTIDGITKTMTFTEEDTAALSDTATVADLLNNKIKETFGTVPDSKLNEVAKVTASIEDGCLVLNNAEGYESCEVKVTSSSGTDALDTLGLTSGASNRIGTSITLGELLHDNSGFTEYYVNINGVAVNLGSSDTKLSEALAAINKSGAGVKAAYDSTADKVVLTSTTSGASGSVKLSDSAVTVTDSDGNATSVDCSKTTAFFSALNITQTESTNQRDAVVLINGTRYARSSNNFTINGVTYSINSAVDPAAGVGDTSGQYTANVSFIQDTSTIEKNIRNFISAYNTLVDKIISYTNTKPDTEYFPLTDAQKADMSDSEIEKWNNKADDGILYGDSTLRGILDSMRSALYKSVTLEDGSTISLYSIGITTSDDYTKYGKLEIKDSDLEKFENAILTRSGDIAELFTKTSDIALKLTTKTQEERDNQAKRTNEEGIIERLNDVVKRAIGLVDGDYGSLLRIAGTSTYCTYTNSIYKEMQDKEDQLDQLKKRLKEKQDRLYNEFMSLETYMTQANTQSGLISSMLGS